MSNNNQVLGIPQRVPGTVARLYDCIGVGFGPANIALAIALEERGLLQNTVFLEKAAGADWNPEMLMAGSDIQHNPLRDFVTPRDPTSRYGFLSYLKHKERLFQYLNLDAPFPPRSEYAEYVKWVAQQFESSVRYSNAVAKLEIISNNDVPVYRITTSNGSVYLSKTVSFAPGRSPNIPPLYQAHMGERMTHLTRYNTSIKKWIKDGNVNSVAVIGASQSAAEIILDIHGQTDDMRVCCISRSFAFKLKDTSPFTEKIYEPEFVDYFYNAKLEKQKALRTELFRSNYCSADHDVIAGLQMLLYEQSVLNKNRVEVRNNVSVDRLSRTSDGGYKFDISDKYSGEKDALEFDAVILATGFLNYGTGDGQELLPEMLRLIAGHCKKRKDGTLCLTRDFALEPANKNDNCSDVGGFHLNGVCESSHGFGDAGSFSLLSVRSSSIASSIESHLKKIDKSALNSTFTEPQMAKEVVNV